MLYWQKTRLALIQVCFSIDSFLLAIDRTTLREFFMYKLTPYPMSMFKDGLMAKPVKPALYRDFAKDLMQANLPSAVRYVIDGGYFLHKVRWNATMDMRDILPLFLRRFGQNVQVVFDGYSMGKDTMSEVYFVSEDKKGKAGKKCGWEMHKRWCCSSKDRTWSLWEHTCTACFRWLRHDVCYFWDMARAQYLIKLWRTAASLLNARLCN